MNNEEPKAPRVYDVFITVRLTSVTAEDAQALEDRIRDVADDVPGSDVQSSKSAARQL